jgi:hypothetical protein
MKQIEFNPLQKELARSPQAGPHPDSDLLTAFAEGTLLERERKDVFAHLATCADCRELLSAATGAALEPGSKPFLVQRRAHPPLRAWLPWASVAAGILIVCSAELVYRQKLELKQRATIAAENAPRIPSSTNQQALPSTEGVTPGSIARRSAPSETHSAIANLETARALSDNPGSAVSARPHWRIDSSGHAERSFGDGTWQPVLPNEIARMRVVSVFDTEVWIGGENARLYHSSDNGNTWNLVPLPMNNGTYHIIVHIRFQTARTGTVEAADGTSWATVDGGVTWN